ncbi:MAG TPA: PDDEXK nuclease domain-containing protein [Thermoanaerobaculaceae bacterium]|nr:PDDEXK nuclease domain-containing protein [Thermoanaerobaculaceae bacterium]
MAGRKTRSEKDRRPVAQTRRTLGRARPDGQALFPVAPPKSELPSGYGDALGELKARIQQARLRAVVVANAAMIQLYWEIGRTILTRQADEGWGAKVIDRLSVDLRNAFPDMAGLSPRNLRYMRDFASAWPDPVIVQRLLPNLPWGQNVVLLDKLRDPQTRLWYASQCAEHGWSRSILTVQIERRLHERQGKALSNFARTLPPADSDMATEVFKDPYLFDLLATADPRREREVEQALVDHVEKFLLELGAGFAFVGRQLPLEVGESDFRVDLLFYHLKLRCFVVVELKAVPFDPAFVGQLNLYLSAVDDLLKQPEDKPTIGLLLCRSRDRVVVEYALRHLKRPLGVAEWETELTDKLPAELRSSLPTVEEIEAELSGTKRPAVRKRGRKA